MKRTKNLLISLLLLLSLALIACKSLEVENPKQLVIPDYDFPEIPLLPYYYYATPEAVEVSDKDDEWVVPGSFLKALDVYFELIYDLELKYNIDKEMYNGNRESKEN